MQIRKKNPDFPNSGRFADCQTKVGLVTILRNYKVNTCEKSMIPYEFEPTGFTLSTMAYLEVLCAVIAVLLAFCYYSTSAFGFWKNRGIPGPKPVFFFGNSMDIIFSRLSTAQYLHKVYHEFKDELMFGVYMRRSAILVLKDPEIIKDVMVRDFSKFSNRGLIVYEKTEPLSAHLLNLDPERWRPLRAHLNPLFSVAKIKSMFGLVLECADQLERYVDQLVSRNEPVDFFETSAKFTTDVIASCVFGIDAHSMSDESSEFRRIGKLVFDLKEFENAARLRMRLYARKLYELLGYIVPEKRFNAFFTKLVVDAMKYRKEHNIHRPDMIHMLMELKEHPEKMGDNKLKDSLLVAQVFGFFIAGFETSSTTITNALYELALNPNIQDKLRQEINEHFAKHNGEFKYENMKDLKYLDKVYKGLFVLMLTIPKRIMVWIPILAIHRDPDNYPNPDVFNPERFSEESIAARHPMTFLPFGDGPRNCIGGRFADCQIKVGLVTILRKYKVDACEKTMIPYEFEPTGLFQSSQHVIQRATMAYLEVLCAVIAVFLAFCYYSTSAFSFGRIAEFWD
ncbi:putative cytochrome P450 6a20 [Melipona quadrifasciata]|uniref:Putative cytochrome P450 6a20 n=1 Tax=Melipona quadrifasciata TaxID=166423 RepID=A0A0N0BF47_9HYME|nr:putative cytochrome P450 6a20 [Melipona quadrifasciata]